MGKTPCSQGAPIVLWGHNKYRRVESVVITAEAEASGAVHTDLPGGVETVPVGWPGKAP